MGRRKCCGLIPWTISISIIFLLIHTGLLVINIFILNSPEEHVDNIIQFLDTKDERLFNSDIYFQAKQSLIQNSGEYLALPITVNVVLIISNILAGFGAIFRRSLLLLPWILGYLVYILFAAALLVYLMVLLPDFWFKILLFLVVAPLILITASFWIVVVRLFTIFRRKVRKVKSMGVAVPATVYTPEPHSWDVPLPIWALQPPTSTWDPAFLQQIDPRYLDTPQQSRETSRSRKSSSRSRSKSGDSQSYRERHSDSMSLSEKYGAGVYESDRQTDMQSVEAYESDRHPDIQSVAAYESEGLPSGERSFTDWDTRDEEDYSEGEDYHEDGTRRRFNKNPRDISLDPDTSIENIYREENTSIENISTERGHELEVVTENRFDESRDEYDLSIPRPRPKSRSESLALSDKYGNSSERFSNLRVEEEIIVNFSNREYLDK